MYAWNVLMRMACKNEGVPFRFFSYYILLGSPTSAISRPSIYATGTISAAVAETDTMTLAETLFSTCSTGSTVTCG